MTDQHDGYYGVIIPARLEWQGFFIAHEDPARLATLVERIRARYNAETARGRVDRPAPDVAADDQGFFGALCASLIDRASAGDLAGANIFANAIRLVSGKDYFWISARSEPDGTQTTFGPLLTVQDETPANIEQAREALGRLPEVVNIKALRLLKGTLQQR